ncbi:MAG: sigma-54-dependent Fis family transcriptional regulator [Deltaproteobacteria bacterium]|nr:sigma-54-dependent Fis family transcriptional regulator [Deltaproteobacteria bacterium]
MHHETPSLPASVNDLERQYRSLSVLYEIALTVGQTLELKPILDEALSRIIDFMGVDSGVIYVINDSTMEMVPVSFRNLSDSAVRDLSEKKVKIGECMCGKIAECNQEVIIDSHASEDPRFTRDAIRREEMEFYAGLPLAAKGKVVGVLCVITHTPYTPDPDLLSILRAATVPLSLAIENAQIFEKVRNKADLQRRYYNFRGIISCSDRMEEVLKLVRKITDMPSSILISGESGTGKELIARAIHYNSFRREKPFISVNCAAFPESLLESEFFGHTRGAFTGATSKRKGLFEEAHGGSLFLDEVEAMSPALQAKLLRVLQDGTFFKVGSTTPVTVDVRIIAATNKDLSEAVESKTFREDLFYRLNVIRIALPPLRERGEDIPLLARYFLERFAKRTGKNIRRVSGETMELLLRHPWPGNVRELENAIERAIAVTEGDTIEPEDLPTALTLQKNLPEGNWSLDAMEKTHILKVLNMTQGNKKKAAKLLKIDTSTLWRKLKKHQ